MNTEIIVTYCVCDDIVKILGIEEDPQIRMSMAEVMTTAITAALFFCGNQERARIFLKEYGYIPDMLSKSQFNRRLYSINKTVWDAAMTILTKAFRAEESKKEFAVDSFPVSVCQNIRISRCKILQDKKYLGYTASKNKYFYGLKVHMITTSSGKPIEFTITPGSMHDVKAIKLFGFELPKNSSVYADKAYNDYKFENFLEENKSVFLLPQRKSNSKKPLKKGEARRRKKKRKIVETTFSMISNLLPKKIHAVTKNGFEIKLMLFIIAFAFKCFCEMVTT